MNNVVILSYQRWSTHRSVGDVDVSIAQIDRSVQTGWTGDVLLGGGKVGGRSQELKSPRIKTCRSTDREAPR